MGRFQRAGQRRGATVELPAQPRALAGLPGGQDRGGIGRAGRPRIRLAQPRARDRGAERQQRRRRGLGAARPPEQEREDPAAGGRPCVVEGAVDHYPSTVAAMAAAPIAADEEPGYRPIPAPPDTVTRPKDVARGEQRGIADLLPWSPSCRDRHTAPDGAASAELSAQQYLLDLHHGQGISCAEIGRRLGSSSSSPLDRSAPQPASPKRALVLRSGAASQQRYRPDRPRRRHPRPRLHVAIHVEIGTGLNKGRLSHSAGTAGTTRLTSTLRYPPRAATHSAGSPLSPRVATPSSKPSSGAWLRGSRRSQV